MGNKYWLAFTDHHGKVRKSALQEGSDSLEVVQREADMMNRDYIINPLNDSVRVYFALNKEVWNKYVA